MRLQLLVPELLWPEPADQLALGNLRLPGLEWLIARATPNRGARIPFETALASQFGLSTPSLGALRLLGEDASERAIEGHWLCADPVHLRFHSERIILADAGAFELDDAEAQEIAAALNQMFGDVGNFYVAAPRRWYLRLNPDLQGELREAAVNGKNRPISEVAGRTIDRDPTQQPSALAKFLNEVQMFLHAHPVNAKRQRAGKPEINSLWLWGSGSLTRPKPGRFTAVWSNTPLATGLARAAGLPVHPLPASLRKLLALASAGTSQLVVLDGLLPRVIYEDAEGWREAVQALDENWFQPLRSAISKPIGQLDLVAPTIYGQLGWTLQGLDRWKFWRKGRSLGELAGELARQDAP